MSILGENPFNKTPRFRPNTVNRRNQETFSGQPCQRNGTVVSIRDHLRAQTLDKLVANKLMAELLSNSAQPTLLDVEGENTDARTDNQRRLRSKEDVDTRRESISTRRQGSEPTQRNRRNQETFSGAKVD